MKRINRVKDLTEEQQQELSEFYWNTDISAIELQEHYNLPKHVYLYVAPLQSGENCPNCGYPLAYRSRAARDASDSECTNCPHKGRSVYRCHCEYCKAIRAEQQRKHEEAQKQRRLDEYEELLQQVATEEYVRWAISKLSRKDRIFLQAILQVLQESNSPTWQEICNRAKVVSHKSYMSRLLQVNLLLNHPKGTLVPNPKLDLTMIEIKKVRNISNSLRFDVFQRDNHTCQYCGRRPPDVELQVDHLIPVAKGGTDDFDNLVTSCQDCNSGKSAKIIGAFTGGHSKDEWREVIKNKRLKVLETRREQIEEVTQHWAECRGVKRVSSYDMDGILNLVEKYEPTWIKAAIKIASGRKPSNYVKYVAGILQNWATGGPPDYIANPDSILDTKKATDKQVIYVKSLLANLELDLQDFYHKSSFDELTMLDARQLIDALTQDESEADDA